MPIHSTDKKYWPRETWNFPLIHNYEFGFGLSAENAAKCNTIVPFMFQNNDIVDYSTIETNPYNAGFSIKAYGDVCQGSYIPRINVNTVMYIPAADTEPHMLHVDTMDIGIAMLNRLDAFDRTTGTDDIETILELQHSTDDEMTYPLYTGAGGKLFEGGGVRDLTPKDGFADIGLSVDGQLEHVAFDKELFFDAMHYYTNKEMLKSVTQRLIGHTITEPLVPFGRSIIKDSFINVPPLCKSANPYMMCGRLYSVPQVGSRTQYHFAGDTTAIEHLTVKGSVRFNEYNPSFNFERS